MNLHDHTNKITLSCMDNSRGFQIRNLRGYTLSIGIGAGHYCENYSSQYGPSGYERKPTATMEVAIIRDDPEGTAAGKVDFVCLPYDVAGHVPAANLGALIEAVQAHDWARVCFLCNEDETIETNFPLKD